MICPVCKKEIVTLPITVNGFLICAICAYEIVNEPDVEESSKE